MDWVIVSAVAYGVLLIGGGMLHSKLITQSAIQRLLTGKEHRYAHYYTPVYNGLVLFSFIALVSFLSLQH